MTPLFVLVSGAGSIGQRHARNLRAEGVSVCAIVDPDGAKGAGAAKECGCKAYTSFEEALQKEHPSIVFVCTPTALHIPHALIAAKKGAHLFIEKPLSHTREGVSELLQEVKTRKLTCMVGCNMRFHFGPATVKKLLDEGKIGTVKKALVYTGSFLPDWRPSQDYKKSYSADPVQGGAILDCIHEIDLALWYTGPALLSSAKLQPATALGIPVEGTADLTLKHTSGAVSDVHLSFMEREIRRSCEITGTKGGIVWEIEQKQVTLKDAQGAVLATFPEPVPYDLNKMYQAELQHFLACIDRHEEPQGNLEEATSALEIALQAKGRGK